MQCYNIYTTFALGNIFYFFEPIKYIRDMYIVYNA